MSHAGFVRIGKLNMGGETHWCFEIFGKCYLWETCDCIYEGFKLYLVQINGTRQFEHFTRT